MKVIKALCIDPRVVTFCQTIMDAYDNESPFMDGREVLDIIADIAAYERETFGYEIKITTSPEDELGLIERIVYTKAEAAALSSLRDIQKNVSLNPYITLNELGEAIVKGETEYNGFSLVCEEDN